MVQKKAELEEERRFLRQEKEDLRKKELFLRREKEYILGEKKSALKIPDA